MPHRLQDLALITRLLWYTRLKLALMLVVLAIVVALAAEVRGLHMRLDEIDAVGSDDDE